MITFDNGTRLVQDLSELPDLRNAVKLYGDFETTSQDDKKKSTNPWRDCWVAGVGVTVDDVPGAWYVPVNHRHGNNLPEDKVIDWWFDIVSSCKEWHNANVKYDAHVSTNCWGVMPSLDVKLCDITSWAKIIDSDRQSRGGYGLDALSRDLVGEDISQYWEALQPYFQLSGNKTSKDYGRAPADVMAPYCGQDVITGRRVSKYEIANMPEQCNGVWQTETDLTSVLFHIERTGMRVNKTSLQIRELKIWYELQRLDTELTKLVGRTFRPDTNEDCFDVICNQYGLPVLAWTEEGDDEETGEKAGNPSFDKHALAQYLAHPFAPIEVIKRIIAYRKLNTLKNFFVSKYQVQAIDCNDGTGQAVMHPSYNQMVRTGRMSCKDPNQQQLSKDAKELIEPAPGDDITSLDDSQIEFRTIVHYIEDEYAIRAYNENPDTDFHDWVSEIVGVKRKPAKTLNFLMAFGGGKEKLLKALESNVDFVGDLKDQIAEMGLDDAAAREMFATLARRRAQDTYQRYHESLPGLKRTSRHVTQVCQARGYVFNEMGRQRRLPYDRAHIAFNTLNQSLAADMMKARMVKMFKYLHAAGLYGDDKIRMMGQVHDELVFTMPTEWARDSRTQLGLVAFMETAPCQLRVPIRCAIGTSSKHWREACTDKKDGGPCGSITYDRKLAVESGLSERPLEFLR